LEPVVLNSAKIHLHILAPLMVISLIFLGESLQEVDTDLVSEDDMEFPLFENALIVMIVLFEEGAHTLVARGHDHF
jgi:hypothetical protein